MSLEVGKVFEGKVSGITNFGAFVQLSNGMTGLVHISEVAEEYVKDIKSHLKQDQQVKVKVISLENGKISLSIKKALAPKPNFKSCKPPEIDWENKGNQRLSFEDQLSKFMKDSDEKIQGLKKSIDSKRKNGGYRKSSQSF